MPLASFCSPADRFESYRVENPKDRFSCDEAPLDCKESTLIPMPGSLPLLNRTIVAAFL